MCARTRRWTDSGTRWARWSRWTRRGGRMPESGWWWRESMPGTLTLLGGLVLVQTLGGASRVSRPRVVPHGREAERTRTILRNHYAPSERLVRQRIVFSLSCAVRPGPRLLRMHAVDCWAQPTGSRFPGHRRRRRMAGLRSTARPDNRRGRSQSCPRRERPIVGQGRRWNETVPHG